MLNYMEAVKHYSREVAKNCPDAYDDLTQEHGLDASEDLAIVWMLSAIYGRSCTEAEHDLVAFIGIYKKQNDNG